jgi:hypothetical protein
VRPPPDVWTFTPDQQFEKLFSEIVNWLVDMVWMPVRYPLPSNSFSPMKGAPWLTSMALMVWLVS